MNVTVRRGVAEDLPQVLSLVKELAEYEKAPDEVTVTLEEMVRAGFGTHPVFLFFLSRNTIRRSSGSHFTI